MLVSKAKRAKFELKLRIHDLNNVPLVSGTSFIKWHLPSSTAAEHRGRTNKCQIRDHKVNYEYEKTTTVRLNVGKDGMLQDCAIEFEVLQEYSSGGKGERIRLGEIRLNLAEYVEASEAQSPSPEGPSDEGVVRRYLMQDSKINSTLKIGVHMRHVEGTRDYYAPPLRTAPVFGGIAGIIHSSEPVPGIATVSGLPVQNPSGAVGDNEADGLPSVNLSSTNKEVGEMQDMYRRTLAAYWASQPGELRADESIEDIFAGGDGWGKEGRPTSLPGTQISGVGDANGTLDHDHDTTPTRRHHHHHRRNAVNEPPRHNDDDEDEDSRTGWRPGPMKQGGVTMRPNVGMRYNRRGNRHVNAYKGSLLEVDEYDVRDDMRSWKVRESVYG